MKGWDLSTEWLRHLREQVVEAPYLYVREPHGEWQVNRRGTILTPVWQPVSEDELAILQEVRPHG